MKSPFNRGKDAFLAGMKRWTNPFGYYDDYANHMAWQRGYDYVRGGGR